MMFEYFSIYWWAIWIFSFVKFLTRSFAHLRKWIVFFFFFYWQWIVFFFSPHLIYSSILYSLWILHIKPFLDLCTCNIFWSVGYLFALLIFFILNLFFNWRIIALQNCIQFSCSVMSNSLWPHESQHARPPCPSPTPGVHSDSRPSSQWCHPATSSSVVPFSSCPQSLSASESFPMSQLFAWG